jgi:hypothetical protein
MRSLCMINADKQTYITQTGPGINGQTSGTTSQKRKPGPLGKLPIWWGATDTRKHQSLQGNKGQCCGSNNHFQGQRSLIGDTSRITENQRLLLGIGKGSQSPNLGILQQYTGIRIRSVREATTGDLIRKWCRILWGTTKQQKHIKHISLLTTERNISAKEKEN